MFAYKYIGNLVFFHRYVNISETFCTLIIVTILDVVKGHNGVVRRKRKRFDLLSVQKLEVHC